MRGSISHAVILTLLLAGSAAGAPAVPDAATTLAPFVDMQTFAVASIDVGQVDFAGLKQQAIASGMRSTPQGEAILDSFEGWSRQLGADGSRLYLVATLAGLRPKPIGKNSWSDLERAVFIVAPRISPAARQFLQTELGKTNATAPIERVLVELHGAHVMGSPALVERLKALQPVARPEFFLNLDKDQDCPVRIALAPPPVFTRAAREILRTPLAGDDRPFGLTLAEGFRAARIGVDPNNQHPTIKIVVQSNSEAAATALNKAATQAVDSFVRSLPQKHDPTPADALELPTPKTQGDEIVLSIDGPALREFGLGPGTLFERWASRLNRMKSMSNLMHIALALHNYHDAHKHFPTAAILSKDGRPLLSWRVAILPYMDGQQQLYQQFHLDEPWDSEHNRQLISRMPEVFRDPRSVAGQSARTRYLAPVGPSLSFEIDKPHTIKDFTDGTVKTILLAEADAEHAVTWTRPEDLTVDLNAPSRGLSQPPSDVFLTAFTDGSAHALPLNAKPEILRALFTRNGGEIVSFEW